MLIQFISQIIFTVLITKTHTVNSISLYSWPALSHLPTCDGLFQLHYQCFSGAQVQVFLHKIILIFLLLLLSRFSCVRLSATP